MGEGNRAGAGAQDDDVVFIKPEPVDEDLSMVGASGDGGGLFRPEEEDALPKAEDGEEQYFEEDVKPTLKVTCAYPPPSPLENLTDVLLYVRRSRLPNLWSYSRRHVRLLFCSSSSSRR